MKPSEPEQDGSVYQTRRDCLKNLPMLALTSGAMERGTAIPQAEELQIPDWVVYPDKQWVRMKPAEAGLDADRMNQTFANVRKQSHFGYVRRPNDDEWGAVVTRGGYLISSFGNPKYRCQSASLGKSFTRAVLGLAVDAGLIEPDDFIWKTWTGKNQLSHPHKYLDQGHHTKLTWRELVNHRGGFVVESGYNWRIRSGWVHDRIPEWAKWTGDPTYDNYSHTTPGVFTSYSSGGYCRLGQALTALWNQDIKAVLDEKLFNHLGIPADRWEWTPAQVLHDNKEFYPNIPGYGEYMDPPYEINGHIVRGGPGWVLMSSEDLARFGLLIATKGIWKGKRLISSEWIQGHGGTAVHVVAGDPETFVSLAKLNTIGFPFGEAPSAAMPDVERSSWGAFCFPGKNIFSFPKDLIVGSPKARKS